jgi:hypothetical protein
LKQRLTRLVIGLTVVFAAIQFYRPERTNPPEQASQTIFADPVVWRDAPPAVERACLNCHSHRTKWPWYSHVSPASWFMAGHVREGREHMNLSDWQDYDQIQKAGLLQDICKEVRAGAMPLRSYLLLHPGARLSAEDRQIICAWTEAARARLASSP